MPIPKGDVVSEIQGIARADDGRLFLTMHLRERMLERTILERQVYQCIRHGLPVGDPVWNTEVDPGWKVVFERYCAGERLRVATKLINDNGHLVVVMSAYWRGREDV